MPIPFLPAEIVTEIVSHLRTSPEFTHNEQVDSGKAISRVCRSWSPAGQALRWNKIVCGTYHMISLSTHLDLYPHLSRLILELEVPSKMDEMDRATIEDLERGRDLLPDLLNSTTNLRALDLTDDSGVLNLILPAISRLNSLQSFKAVVYRRCVWTPEMISLYNNGFPSLQSFSLSNSLLSLSDAAISLLSKPTKVRKKKLHHLSLHWCNVRKQDTSRLVSHFLSMTDINSLQSCTLMGAPLCSSTLEWLSDAPNFRRLEVSYESLKFASALPTLLEHLPNLITLEEIQISVDSWSRSLTFTSPIPIHSLLSALPTNLQKCDVRQLQFDDYKELPASEPHSAEGRESYCIVELQKNGSLFETSPLLVWRGKGELNCPWRRCSLRADSREEYDAKGQVSRLLPLASALFRIDISIPFSRKRSYSVLDNSPTYANLAISIPLLTLPSFYPTTTA